MCLGMQLVIAAATGNIKEVRACACARAATPCVPRRVARSCRTAASLRPTPTRARLCVRARRHAVCASACGTLVPRGAILRSTLMRARLQATRLVEEASADVCFHEDQKGMTALMAVRHIG